MTPSIPTKTRRELERMREAARHVGEILVELKAFAAPGVTTGEIDALARKRIRERKVESSFLGYGPHGLPGYPGVICLSVNEEIVHGIPGRRELKEGDILGLDFGVSFEGWHGDSAVTIAIGPAESLAPTARRLLEATREALYAGIEQMRAGHRLSDIGHAVQQRAERDGFSVVRQFVGHGIGRRLHEAPQIPNFGEPGRGPRLLPGMVFAIEPMVNVGGADVRMLEDQWTAVTADGSLSAHFEHTVLITDQGPEILTQVPGSH
ncbi:MAG TPA: type I methionyl aminopeptidase [Myxococcota bacterium]|jgi:methionyl aminopeptidase|nr:type I methionyl aminopeptidase [Myxococcota bacterium]